MKNLIINIIIIIVSIAVGFLIRGKDVEIVESTSYIYDTITEIKQVEISATPTEVIKIKWDTVVVADTEYKYLYYKLMDSLNTTNKYQLILKNDSAAYIGIEADIFANTLSDIEYTYQNRTPTQINHSTNVINNGDGLYVQGITNFNSTSFNFVIQNKNIMYSVGYDTKGRLNVGLGYKVK